MDRLPLPLAAPAAAPPPPQAGRVLDVYRKAVEAVATVTACVVLARTVPRELFPDELRGAARWCAAAVRARLGWGAGAKERHTVVIRRHCEGAGPGYGHGENPIFDAARTYLDARMDPRALRRLSLSGCRATEPDGTVTSRTLVCMEPGCPATDVFDGVAFTWACVEAGGEDGKGGKRPHALELSFDAEHTETALQRYVPFVVSAAMELQLADRALRIFMNEGRSWHGINHHHPATFDTLAMDTALKRDVIADLDRFVERRDYYRRIGKAWKRGYLLYGPPGTGKSSLVAAMANHLRFNLYDLDLSAVRLNSELQRLLIAMPNKSILVVEDIDCCFDAAAASREDGKAPDKGGDGLDSADYSSDDPDDEEESLPFQAHQMQKGITLSGLLNFIDGLWSTTGEQRIIVFTTNYKDRLDPALLRQGRMDMHVYMGYCGWEAFRTLAWNYLLVDDHALFPEIRELLSAVEVTAAEVSEMLLRSEDAGVALQGIVDLLQGKKKTTKQGTRKAQRKDAATASA